MYDDENDKFDSSILPDPRDLGLGNASVESGGIGLANDPSVKNPSDSIVVPVDLVLKDDFEGDDFTSGPNVVVPPRGLEVEEEEEDVEWTGEEETDEEREKRKALKDAKRYPTFICPKCHMSFCTLNKMGATRCFYCGSTGLQKVADTPFVDLKLVPFMDTLKDAGETYKKQIRFNPLIPFSFRNKKNLKRMRKIFIQCSLFDIVTEGNVSFLGADKISNVKGAPMHTFDCMYSTQFEYKNLLCSNSSLIRDNIISSINNYNYSMMRDFDENMLGDSCLIAGDLNPDAITNTMSEKTIKYSVNVVRGNVGHELKKVNKNEITPNIKSFKNVAIPIYYLSINYKGKDYRFIMNGQSGESYIDLPISGLSIGIFSFVVVLVVFLLCFLVASLM